MAGTSPAMTGEGMATWWVRADDRGSWPWIVPTTCLPSPRVTQNLAPPPTSWPGLSRPSTELAEWLGKRAHVVWRYSERGGSAAPFHSRMGTARSAPLPTLRATH